MQYIAVYTLKTVVLHSTICVHIGLKRLNIRSKELPEELSKNFLFVFIIIG